MIARVGYGPPVAFLDGLGADCVNALTALGRVRRYPRGSLLFAEGDAGNEVLLIRSGSVKVFVTSLNGREVVLEVMEAGDLLGELSAIDAEDRSASAIALSNVEVLAVAHGAFLRRMQEDPALSVHLLRMLATRMRGAGRRQLEFGSNDALGRLCHRFLELVRRSDAVPVDGSITVMLPMSQQDLAGWSGLSREAVVKGMQTLRRLGWIETHGRDVVILDLPAITKRADA